MMCIRALIRRRVLDPDRINAPRKAANIKVSFVGANLHPRVEPFYRQDTTVSYFIGNDPDQWRPEVPVWGGVRYVDLYPGIDLEIMSDAGQVVQRLAARPALIWRRCNCGPKARTL